MKSREGIKVVNLAVNLPGPSAAQQLTCMGAEVIKVEPPSGDPMETCFPDWYCHMVAGHTVRRLDLKSEEGKEHLMELLSTADLLLAATRPSAMQRLGLAPETLQPKFPRLCQVMIKRGKYEH